MIRKKILILTLIIAILLLVFIFWKDISDFYSKLALRLPEMKKEVEKQISLPPPLRSEKEHPESFLTKDGVIEWTNIQREKYDLLPLEENIKLENIAQEKLEDMFENQYFAHQSPSGQKAMDLAKKFTYEFLAIGENLALGNFENDKVLVDAWMDSSGHRANILNSVYREIGVAVGKGMFEGEMTWLVVQIFGLPLSVCPQLDSSLKAEIDKNQQEILDLEKKLSSLEEEIRMMRPRRKGEEYNQKVEEYNTLVSQHNALIEENRILINKYNLEIDLFNQCVVEFSI